MSYYNTPLVKAPASPSSPPMYLAHLSVTTPTSTPPTAATGAATATNTQRSRADTQVEVEDRSSRPPSYDVIGETYFELSGADGELAITDVMCLQVEYVKTRSPTAAATATNDNPTAATHNNINNNTNNSVYNTTASTTAGAAGEDISLLTYNTTASPRFTTQKDGRNPVWQYMLRVKLCKQDNATTTTTNNNNKNKNKSSSDVYKDREYAQSLAEKRSEL